MLKAHRVYSVFVDIGDLIIRVLGGVIGAVLGDVSHTWLQDDSMNIYEMTLRW